MKYYDFKLEITLRAKNKSQANNKLYELLTPLRREIEPKSLTKDRQQKLKIK